MATRKKALTVVENNELEIPVHPLACRLPMMPDDVLQPIVDDMRKNGFDEDSPCTLDQYGNLVDGRNRIRAAKIAGIEPQFVTREFKDEQAVKEFVCRRNV